MANPKINAEQIDVGTGANQIVQLDGSGNMPAVDGSSLTNLPTGPGSITILDAPVLLASSLTEDSWTTINSTTLGTAGATGAIIRMTLSSRRTSEEIEDSRIEGYLRKTGSGLTVSTTNRCFYAGDTNRYSSAEDIANPKGSVDVTITLDVNSDFDYYVNSEHALNASYIILVGYYS